jgi:hypothetical protein
MLWMPGVVAAILTAGVSIAAGRVASTLLAGARIAILVYAGWLLILAGIGALAAYWSRRAGGSIANRTAAALIPAATIVAALGSLVTNPELKMALIASVFTPADVPILRVLPAIGNSVIGGILLPAIALLMGALPFLRGDSAGNSLRVGAA